LFDDKYLGRYLFFSILITVLIAESLILIYTRLDTPPAPAAQKKRVISLHIATRISKPKVKKEPKRVCNSAIPPKPPVVKPKPKPKPKSKPKLEPKPKPKPKAKPKKPSIKKF